MTECHTSLRAVPLPQSVTAGSEVYNLLRNPVYTLLRNIHAAILGIVSLSKAAEELEMHCRNGRIEDPRPKVEHIVEALEALLAEKG